MRNFRLRAEEESLKKKNKTREAKQKAFFFVIILEHGLKVSTKAKQRRVFITKGTKTFKMGMGRFLLY